jgi:hypothetical protein
MHMCVHANVVLSDLMHTYLSLAGLSLLHEPRLNPVQAALNITERAYAHWQTIWLHNSSIRNIGLCASVSAACDGITERDTDTSDTDSKSSEQLARQCRVS